MNAPSRPPAAASAADIAQMRELLRRAVLTLAAVPDPDLKFRVGPKTAWPPMVQQIRDAYGAAPPKIRAFQPTARDISLYVDVLGWLNWYGRERSEQDVKLFTAWVFGTPIWMLQERCGTNRRQPATPKTVYNRLDRLAGAIVVRFGAPSQRTPLDGFHELHEKAQSSRYGTEAVLTDVKDLRKSPRTWIAADGKPLPYSHPLAVEARKADAESARRKRKANRRRGRRPKKRRDSKTATATSPSSAS